MKANGLFDEEWAKRAASAKAKGERALALLAETDDPSDCFDAIEDALRDALRIVSHLLDVESTRAELENPTWRPVHRERDRIRFANDLGQTGSLRTRVGVAVARGKNLPYPTRMDGDEVVFTLEDGEEDRAPLSLVRALSPRRWPAEAPTREVRG